VTASIQILGSIAVCVVTVLALIGAVFVSVVVYDAVSDWRVARCRRRHEARREPCKGCDSTCLWQFRKRFIGYDSANPNTQQVIWTGDTIPHSADGLTAIPAGVVEIEDTKP